MGWGPFNSHSILLCLRRGVLTFRFRGCNPPFQNIENVLYPVGVCNADTVGGPIVFTYVLFCVRKRILDFQILNLQSAFLRPPECFIPRRDSAEQSPKGVQLFLLMFYFGLGNVYWTFNLQSVFCLFETSKMFSPPEGLCRAEPEGGPIFFTYVLFWVRKRILDFQFTGGFFPFGDLENVLSPGGTLQSRARKGFNCFYLCFIGVGRGPRGFNLLAVFCLFENPKMFYPPEGLCRAEPERGPIVFTYV